MVVPAGMIEKRSRVLHKTMLCAYLKAYENAADASSSTTSIAPAIPQLKIPAQPPSESTLFHPP